MPEMAMPRDQEVSVRIQKTKNGFLAHHTVSGPNVKDGYKSETVFHRKCPAASKRIRSMMRDMDKDGV